MTKSIRDAMIASKKKEFEKIENVEEKATQSAARRLFAKAQQLLNEDPIRKQRSSKKPAQTESPKREAKIVTNVATISTKKPSSSKVEAADDNKNKKKSKKRSREEEDVKLRKKIKKEKENGNSISLSSTDFFMDPAALSRKERRRRRELEQQREDEERARRKAKKRARKEEARKEEALRAETEDPDKEWEVEYVGGIYLEWGQKIVTTSKGVKHQEFYIKDDKDHRVWIKWKDPFADNNSVWSAEVQENLVGIDPDRLEKIFRKKKIYPMPSKTDGLPNWPERLNKVLLAGYRKWKAPRCLRDQDPDEEQTPQFIQGIEVIESTSKVEEIVEETDYETDYDTDEA